MSFKSVHIVLEILGQRWEQFLADNGFDFIKTDISTDISFVDILKTF